ncbi:hypothetical protein E4U44_005229 [Claviceps purpurea]|nr:hypothetical protein E4U44_005229 [Claviceps purpurea]
MGVKSTLGSRPKEKSLSHPSHEDDGRPFNIIPLRIHRILNLRPLPGKNPASHTPEFFSRYLEASVTHSTSPPRVLASSKPQCTGRAPGDTPALVDRVNAAQVEACALSVTISTRGWWNGMVNREVTQVLLPGFVFRDELLDVLSLRCGDAPSAPLRGPHQRQMPNGCTDYLVRSSALELTVS